MLYGVPFLHIAFGCVSGKVLAAFFRAIPEELERMSPF